MSASTKHFKCAQYSAVRLAPLLASVLLLSGCLPPSLSSKPSGQDIQEVLQSDLTALGVQDQLDRYLITNEYFRTVYGHKYYCCDLTLYVYKGDAPVAQNGSLNVTGAWAGSLMFVEKEKQWYATINEPFKPSTEQYQPTDDETRQIQQGHQWARSMLHQAEGFVSDKIKSAGDSDSPEKLRDTTASIFQEWDEKYGTLLEGYKADEPEVLRLQTLGAKLESGLNEARDHVVQRQQMVLLAKLKQTTDQCTSAINSAISQVTLATSADALDAIYVKANNALASTNKAVQDLVTALESSGYYGYSQDETFKAEAIKLETLLTKKRHELLIGELSASLVETKQLVALRNKKLEETTSDQEVDDLESYITSASEKPKAVCCDFSKNMALDGIGVIKSPKIAYERLTENKDVYPEEQQLRDAIADLCGPAYGERKTELTTLAYLDEARGLILRIKQSFYADLGDGLGGSARIMGALTQPYLATSDASPSSTYNVFFLAGKKYCDFVHDYPLNNSDEKQLGEIGNAFLNHSFEKELAIEHASQIQTHFGASQASYFEQWKEELRDGTVAKLLAGMSAGGEPDKNINEFTPLTQESQSQRLQPSEQTAIANFVGSFITAFSDGDIKTVLSFYDTRVNYLDAGSVGLNEVSKEYGQFLERWPAHKWTLVGPIEAEALNATDTQLRFQIIFTVSNPVNGREREGSATEEWIIRSNDSNMTFKIVAQKEQTVNRRAGQEAHGAY